ncbi:GNAT family N-acetyltransferase [Ekhidna sp.]|uniref:GNAT family N-acetyltransferase n=1 Tax=Ekhidna sp. TaxID=2608089 RepID=UPI0035112706
MSIKIQHEETESKGVYFVEVNGERVAEMTYSKAGTDRIIIDHTEVDDSMRGTGLGKKLVITAVEDARKNGISIIPLCSYAKSVFERNEELRDVL